MQILKEGVRNAIVEAAFAEFRQYGYMDASMRRIAAAAGMTSGNIYRYFRSKEDLFDFIVGPVYEQYSSYAKEYLQSADILYTRDKATRVTFFEELQTTLVGLLKASGPRQMLMVCRSEGSKYATIKQELIQFSEGLLLKLFAAAKPEGQPLNAYEQSEVSMLATTLNESLVLIIGQHDDQETLGLLIDRLIAVYCTGIGQLLEEYKKR
ncbi:TetR/AcrR family transcriptional regulator [Paenibacillus spongiae]|uniref:TetR/AcrR family transcriptional regulator n=1 Tax=Paenibacillus spongiae TaxID=2909671 RepID=A0ABY5SKV8_9BACL|nr:TetR/AcrR family transcriptional regulator [Paenibacillus spongiae]UVI33213.1 TetR/AcrR family transcriptional regulator [Paenibacillus spongiae]